MKKTKLLVSAMVALFFIACNKDDGPAPAALSEEKLIVSFKFGASANSALTTDVQATIDQPGKAIPITVPYGTDVTSLQPEIAVSLKATISPTGPQDFTNPVQYTVTAEDNSTSTYGVNVNIAPNDMKQITSYQFKKDDNAGLDSDVIAVIGETESTIVLYVPNNTDVSNLSPNIEISEAATYIPAGAQDFTDPVLYTVTANDGTNRTYEVKVVPIQITEFSFAAADNPSLDENIASIIDQHTNKITLYIPNTADFTNLSPNVAASEGVTVNLTGVQDFTDPLTYKLTAPNGTTQNYEVTVVVVEISRFWFSIFHDIAGEIIIGEGAINHVLNEIEVVVPEDWNTSNLPVPKLAVPNGIGISPLGHKDFTDKVNYKLEAPNGLVVSYEISVKQVFNRITRFRFLLINNPELHINSVGFISEVDRSIDATVTLPKFTSDEVLKSLEPIIEVSEGSTVDPTGPQDFSPSQLPVAYTVTGSNGSKKTYMVSITLKRSN